MPWNGSDCKKWEIEIYDRQFTGVKVTDISKAKAKKPNESSVEGSSTVGANKQTSNENESIVGDTNGHVHQSSSYDSNESEIEEESNEKWASAWKVQHKGVEITTYYSPNNFYVAEKSKLYVFDNEMFCQIVRWKSRIYLW